MFDNGSAQHTRARDAIYEISYDLSQDYLEFIARSTYDSDLQRRPTKISLRNIVS